MKISQACENSYVFCWSGGGFYNLKNKPDDVIMMSPGLYQFRLRDYKYIPESLRKKLQVWSLKVVCIYQVGANEGRS